MGDGPEVGTLALRLSGGLLLTAAGVFGMVAVTTGALPRVKIGSSVRYVVPGTTATLEPTILDVLVGCTGVLGLGGAIALALAGWPGRVTTPSMQIVTETLHVSPSRPTDRPEGVRHEVRRTFRRVRPVFVLGFGTLLLAFAVAVRWHRHLMP